MLDIYYDYPEVIKVLKEMVAETNNRLDKFRNSRVDNINDYNRLGGEYLPRKIIFIDELAELLKTRAKETAMTLYDCIETLTRLSRAVGIHLIMGIQRPDSRIVNGQIKNNVSFRVCGRFVDPEPSRIMLSCDTASSIPNIKGRFYVKDDDLYEVQSFYFDDREFWFIPEEQEPYSDNEEVEGLSEKIAEVMQAVQEPLAEIPEEPQNTDKFDFDFSNFKK